MCFLLAPRNLALLIEGGRQVHASVKLMYRLNSGVARLLGESIP